MAVLDQVGDQSFLASDAVCTLDDVAFCHRNQGFSHCRLRLLQQTAILAKNLVYPAEQTLSYQYPDNERTMLSPSKKAGGSRIWRLHMTVCGQDFCPEDFLHTLTTVKTNLDRFQSLMLMERTSIREHVERSRAAIARSKEVLATPCDPRLTATQTGSSFYRHQ